MSTALLPKCHLTQLRPECCILSIIHNLQSPRQMQAQDLDKNSDSLSSCASLTYLENTKMVLLYKILCSLTLLCLFYLIFRISTRLPSDGVQWMPLISKLQPVSLSIIKTMKKVWSNETDFLKSHAEIISMTAHRSFMLFAWPPTADLSS